MNDDERRTSNIQHRTPKSEPSSKGWAPTYAQSFGVASRMDADPGSKGGGRGRDFSRNGHEEFNCGGAEILEGRDVFLFATRGQGLLRLVKGPTFQDYRTDPFTVH